LRRVGVETIRTSGEKVDLSYALSELTERFGVRKVRVDSGGALATAMLQAKMVDELVVMIFPYIVGGTSIKTFYLSPEPDGENDVLIFEMIKSQPLRGGVQLLRYRIVGR
jgi:2,5-diamino-6-(ribosylamino)-4(3H)-pyrimidinone 5'-phosphate reductase